MKRLTTLLLAAGLVFGISTGSAQAIDFKAQGQWLMGFTYGQGGMIKKVRDGNVSKKPHNDDQFEAAQRIRLQLHAVASENLSGTLYFEIGTSTWGQAGGGAALGADDKIVKVKRAYLDWAVPETALKVRMGVQGVALPSAAGGSSVLDDDVAGVVASYQFNDNVGLTAMWLRPWNDNHNKSYYESTYEKNAIPEYKNPNYLDNIDLFALALPLKFDGVELTPWLAYGMVGSNTANNIKEHWDGYYAHSFLTSGYADRNRWNVKDDSFNKVGQAYRDMFWAGLPIKVTTLDPFNIEFDVNYGYMGGIGRGTLERYDANTEGNKVGKRFDTRAEGWLVKALFEYKMDWGVPGILGWYASGDDSNPSNGSERMPSVGPAVNFTSTFGDGNYGWGTSGRFYDRTLTYSGTWGVGLQIRDMSFVENLKHTFRAVYRGGTNSPAMAKYANSPWSWGTGVDYEGVNNELYLTTKDSILEFNLVNAWKLYENFEVNLELGYAVNFIDHSTWKKSYGTRSDRESFQKQDAWKAQLIFAYQF